MKELILDTLRGLLLLSLFPLILALILAVGTALGWMLDYYPPAFGATMVLCGLVAARYLGRDFRIDRENQKEHL